MFFALCSAALLLFGSTGFAQQIEVSRLQDVVAALSGADEITPGKQLTDRRTAANRQLVRTYLARSLQERGLQPQTHNYGSGENIYATIPSTGPADSMIVIGAHYDSVSRSPGANDNATGVALIYGVATYLAQRECLSKDVMIVFFDEEESGLIGSRNFAGFLKNSSKTIHSVHTVDQVGWDKDGDRALELELPTPELEAIYRSVATAGGYTMPLHRTSTSSTDHSSFRRLGFPAVGITEEYVHGDTTPHYHRSSDTFETVDFAYLEDSTRFISEVIGHLTRCDQVRLSSIAAHPIVAESMELEPARDSQRQE